MDLEFTDRVALGFVTESDELREALQEHTKTIATETLAVSVDFEQIPDAEEETLDLDGHALTITLKRVATPETAKGRDSGLVSKEGNTQPLRLAVLLSGSGRTLENLLLREKSGNLFGTVELVISNREGVRGVTIAESAGIRTIVNPQGNASLDTWSTALFGFCREANVDLVVMAGFLQLVAIPDDFVNRVINIHPSLLPAFGGKGFYGNRVHTAVIQSGATTSGCTVHFVDNEYDHGTVVLQRKVPVAPDDSPETLAARVFVEECEALPEAINLLAKQQRTKR